MASNLTLLDELNTAKERLLYPEQILGKGLDQPCNPSCSGARKILYGIQKEHVVPLVHPERPHYQTGYEIRFGDESSSIIKAEYDQNVAGIVPKFSFAPQQCYTVFVVSDDGTMCDIYERKPYEHTTEKHGYMYNNNYIDGLYPGAHISEGDIVRKSTSYDEYNNRCDGRNEVCVYIATCRNTEDSLIMSESAAKDFATPMINKITIICNDNDIPINLRGENGEYKVIPDIGEEVQTDKNGISVKGRLFAQRRQNKEYALFTESAEMMKKVLISDDSYIVDGQVVDINVYSNNKNLLATSEQYGQINKYYQESIRYCSDIINMANQIRNAHPNIKFSYNLQKLVTRSEDILAGKTIINDNGNAFNNTVIEMIVVNYKPVEVGDKLSDRYGGKGVVSFIIPDELMPMNKWGERAKFIVNKCTCVGRENPGQLFETSLNYMCSTLIRFLREGNIDVDKAAEMVIKFLSVVVPEEAEALGEYFYQLDEEQLATYLDSILMDGVIDISGRPIQDNMTLDKLASLYDEFPWITLDYVKMPIQDSMGNWRMVDSYRPIVFGKKYMYRLKQYSEEKFSVTSLGATNVKNLNTKSKASKYYKSTHSNTPIAMGTMEIDSLSHIGSEYVVAALMIHSVSPQARRLCEQMLTGDPFIININLNSESANRNVEILNAYLKTKGVRITFKKVPKKRNALMATPLIQFVPEDIYSVPLIRPIKEDKFNIEEYYRKLEEVERLRKTNLITRDLIQFNK